MMRRRPTGWSRFLMVYTPAVIGLFVVLCRSLRRASPATHGGGPSEQNE
jgi:hypothetical protein